MNTYQKRFSDIKTDSVNQDITAQKFTFICNFWVKLLKIAFIIPSNMSIHTYWNILSTEYKPWRYIYGWSKSHHLQGCLTRIIPHKCFVVVVSMKQVNIFLTCLTYKWDLLFDNREIRTWMINQLINWLNLHIKLHLFCWNNVTHTAPHKVISSLFLGKVNGCMSVWMIISYHYDTKGITLDVVQFSG